MKDLTIKVGKGRKPLTLDAALLVTRCALVQGGRDSGKSYLVRVIVEQTIQGGLQTIVLDPEGEFSTLRQKCSVLIVGEDGDLPLRTDRAKPLARRIADTGVSTVVDLSGLRPHDRYEFVRLFLDAFDQLPKSLQKRPRLFVLDEAHLYCPESGKGKASSAESVVTLLSQGRKRGHGTILVTQRLSKLRKDAANECGTLFIGRTAASDLARAQDELGITKDDREQLRNLPTGTFWAGGSGIGQSHQVEVRKALTSHPSPGDFYRHQTPPAPKEITKLLADFAEPEAPSSYPTADTSLLQQFDDAPAAAMARMLLGWLTREQVERFKQAMGKTKWSDLEKAAAAKTDKSARRHLREFVAMLRRKDAVARTVLDRLNPQQAELVADITAMMGQSPATRPGEKVRAENERLKADNERLEARNKGLELRNQALEEVLAEERATIRKTAEQLTGIAKVMVRPATKITTPEPPPPPPRPARTPSLMPRLTPPPRSTSAPAKLPFAWSSAPGKLLTVAIQHHPQLLERRRIAALAGVRYRSSTFRNALTKLRAHELICESGDTFGANDEAVEDHGAHVQPLPSGDELIQGWSARLGGAALQIFNELIVLGGEAPRAEVCERAGVDATRSTARNAYTKLRNLGLIEPKTGDRLQLTAHVMEAIDG